MQGALASFIDGGGFARHVRRMRAIYRARHELIVATIQRLLDDELSIVPSSVGLHIGTLARRASVARIDGVVRAASEAGVECHPLAMFAAGGEPRAGLILGYGSIRSDRIEEGIARLRRAFAT
jgi:GntR family transcriptional regulator/MocR family aminotransferase